MITVLLANLRSILIGIAVVAVLAAAYAVYSKIRSDAFNEARVATIEAELKEAKKSAEAWRAASKRDREQAIEDGQLVAKYEEQVEDLLSELENADSECLAGPDTKRMLDAWDIFSSGRPAANSK